jgi:hypothetical protein
MPPVIGAAVSDEAKLHAPRRRAQIDKRRDRSFILLCYCDAARRCCFAKIVLASQLTANHANSAEREAQHDHSHSTIWNSAVARRKRECAICLVSRENPYAWRRVVAPPANHEHASPLKCQSVRAPIRNKPKKQVKRIGEARIGKAPKGDDGNSKWIERDWILRE